MAKKTKKIPDLQLQGFDEVDFKKEPDVQAAQKIIQSAKLVSEPTPKRGQDAPLSKPAKVVREEVSPEYTPIVPQRTIEASKQETPVKQVKKEEKTTKGTVAPTNKKRASFNIDEDLHRALKEYSFFEEIDMVVYIFEELVKPDLKKKGYYPPRRRRKR